MRTSHAALLALCMAGLGHAQSLDDLRQELSSNLRQAAFAGSVASLVLAAEDFELSGARYRIDDAVGTRLTVIALPYARSFRPWGPRAPALRLEGVAGFAGIVSRTSDLYDGGAPGFETGIRSETRTFAGLAGVGLDFELTSDWTVTPLLDLGLARLENDADYGGPGAVVSRALLDGLAFNWNAWASSYGPAVRTEWRRALGRDVGLTIRGRYDLRWTDSFGEDDPAQEFSQELQVLTARADLEGPVAGSLAGHALRWRVTGGYRHFLEGDIAGITDFAQVGVELSAADLLPFGSGLTLSGALIFGEDVRGYSLGLGVSF